MRIFDFDKVIGNRSTINMIKKSLARNAYPKFTILSGDSGTGKSTSAEIIGMALTCKNPINGLPCQECVNCKDSINQLSAGHSSRNIVKKNIGLLNSKSDFLKIIKETFTLQPIETNAVYIFEEVHALAESEQTALLEEVTKLSTNTYVIFCTTKKYKIIKELVDRSYPFNFKTLKDSEMKLVLDNTCKELNYNILDKSLEEILIKYSSGVPRKLVQQLDFISKAEPTVEELRESLGLIDTSVFLNLLVDLCDDAKVALKSIDDVVKQNDRFELINNFREFLANALFYLNGATIVQYKTSEKRLIKELLDTKKISKMLKRIDSVCERKSYVTDTELRLLFIKIRQIMNEREVVDIFSENTEKASEQNQSANRLYNEKKESSLNKLASESGELDLNSFANYFNR